MRGIKFALAACALLTTAQAWAARGGDGELKILFWQAVSTLNPYLSGGIKEEFASSIILEPLANFNEKGDLVARLAESLPTVENGGVAADFTSITWKLKPGVKWSDGSDLTAADVVFTWNYCTAPGGGCAMAHLASPRIARRSPMSWSMRWRAMPLSRWNNYAGAIQRWISVRPRRCWAA